MERWRCEMKPLKKSSHADMMPQVEVKIHQESEARFSF